MILTFDLAKKTYIFRSFWDRDDCYRLLQDLRNKSKIIDKISGYTLGHSEKSSIIDKSPKSYSQTDNNNNNSFTDVSDNHSESESSETGKSVHFYLISIEFIDIYYF